MRRLLPVLLALVCAALLPAAAQGAAVGAPAKQKPADVRAYWTDERMRDAKPKERVRDNGPQERGKPAKPGGGGGGGSLAVDWNEPYAATNGKVFFTEDGVNYVCSGTALESATDQVVLTAGHCVHGGAGGSFHTNWQFVPRYGTGTTYPGYAGRTLYTTSEWAGSTEYGRDVGTVRVDRTFGPEIGDRRTVNYDTRPPIGTPVVAYGYPAAGKFNGRTLRSCTSTVTREDARSDPAAMGIPCDMTGGSSGGGWVAGGQLVSVNSYGYGTLKNTMFGPSLLGTDDVLAAADSGGPSSAL